MSTIQTVQITSESRKIFKQVLDFFSTLYRYREYFKQSVTRDLRKRYKRSVLGYFWSMLHPLLMMVILTLVFSHIMRLNIENYAIFLFTGMLPFRFFESSLQYNLHTISGNINIINQMPVPKYIFPMATIISNMIDYFLSLIPLFLLMLVLGASFHLEILFFPFVLLPLFLIAFGAGLFVASLNVFFRDTEHLTSVATQALYFLCPILYDRSMLPESVTTFFLINPLFGIIENIRNIFYAGLLPDFGSYLYTLIASIIVFVFGLYVFRKAEDKFIYFV